MPTDFNILVLDSSTIPCCAALTSSAEGVTSHGFAAFSEPRELSSHLMRLIDAALNQAAWTLDAVDLLAVGLGPGSWTGLRIGISAFKTLAQARELPLCGVGTFDAICACVRDSHKGAVGIVSPSRPGEIYGAIGQGNANDPLTVGLWTPQEFAHALAASDSSLTLAGADATTLDDIAAVLRSEGHEPQLVLPTERDVLSALGQIAVQRYQSGQREAVLRVEPLYLAPSNAERARAAKLLAAAGTG